MITLLERDLKPTNTPDVVKPASDTDADPALVPPYAVILHNDNLTTMEYVVVVLMRVFHYGVFKSYSLMWAVHTKGRAPVWSGAKEEAESKAAALRDCGPDPIMRLFGAKTLRVTVEAQPI